METSGKLYSYILFFVAGLFAGTIVALVGWLLDQATKHWILIPVLVVYACLTWFMWVACEGDIQAKQNIVFHAGVFHLFFLGNTLPIVFLLVSIINSRLGEVAAYVFVAMFFVEIMLIGLNERYLNKLDEVQGSVLRLFVVSNQCIDCKQFNDCLSTRKQSVAKSEKADPKFRCNGESPKPPS